VSFVARVYFLNKTVVMKNRNPCLKLLTD